MEYSPLNEPNSERFLLIDLEAPTYGGEYRHIKAEVVRKTMKTYTDADTGTTRYGDGEDTGYRRASWSNGKTSAVRVHDLELHSQMNSGDKSRNVYGMEFRFKPWDVKHTDALQIAQTFKKLDKGFEKLNDELGYCKDYADYAIRMAHVLGIRKFLFRRKDTHGGLSDERSWSVARATDVRWHIEQLAEEVFGKKEENA